MSLHAAFLRAVNVGGHSIRMEDLRRLFASLGFADVETFIASGNVVFATADADTRALERRIESALLDAYGFEVATFVRTLDELADIAVGFPSPDVEGEAALTRVVAFTSRPLDEADAARVASLSTADDAFVVRGREVFWLCRTRQSESVFSNAVLERTLGSPTTMRGASTVERMVAKWGPRAAGGSS